MVEKLTELTETKLSEPLTVYRGVGGKAGAELLGRAEKLMASGGTMTDDGFSSTSLDARRATRYADGKVIMQIETSKGSYIDSVSGSKGEQEFLMSRGTKYSVSGIDHDVKLSGMAGGGGYTVIRLKAV